MFGSKPFMFIRLTSEQRLSEGALSTLATESGAVVWRARCFFSPTLLAPFLYSLV
jgi:hypothetical protein